jgi:hypothetical protein
MDRINNQPNRNISQGMNGIFGSANNYQQQQALQGNLPQLM